MSVQAKVADIDIDEVLARKARRKDLMMALLPFAGLVFIVVVLTAATGGLLLSGGNLSNIINQCFTNAIVAVGACFVYAYGGMDFSIGASCGVAQLVCVAIVVNQGLPVWLGVLAATAVAVTNTMIVGLGSNLLRLQPFIVSLCVRSACTGILVVGCNALDKNIRVPLHTFRFFSNDVVKIITLVAIVGLGWYLFEKTSLGKQQKAVGGNRVTAFQSGVRIRKGVVLSHLLLGLCVAIAGVFQLTRNGMVSTQSASGLEFNIMIALALGGFPMAGGASAKIRAAIVGVLTITILTNGLTLAGMDSDYISIIKGLLFIIIVAISYDRSNLKQVVFM